MSINKNNKENKLIYVNFYASGEKVKYFELSNGDRQFLFSDGVCIILHREEYYVSC